MFLFLKLFRESYLFAMQAIIVNKLRTFLSLLGITIGIFAVITVFTIVDSMEITIKKSIESLGNNVLFIQKWPWSFGNDYPWWKYVNRPVPAYEEMSEIMKRSNTAGSAAFILSMQRTVKFRDNSVENADIVCVSHDYDKVWSFGLSSGRYFSSLESQNGRSVALVGDNIAKALFPTTSALGQQIKVLGRDVEIIGVFEKEGSDQFGGSSDNQVVLPVLFARNIIDISNEFYNPIIAVKARPGVSNAEMKDELTGILRSVRSLKPASEDNFAINETDLLTRGFENLFSIIGIAGWIIGGFALLVGGFGIANIMFVSVRERTHIIGIQKSLGAKNYFILFEFLFEAVFLCIFGGALGLLLVYAGTLLVSGALDMDMGLTASNIFLGFFVSAFIGLVAGFVPAWSASRMDPVVAIRSNG